LPCPAGLRPLEPGTLVPGGVEENRVVRGLPQTKVASAPDLRRH
jgi:hypothetical protein